MFDKNKDNSNQSEPNVTASDFSFQFAVDASGRVIQYDHAVLASQGGFGPLNGIQTMDALGSFQYNETITVSNN